LNEILNEFIKNFADKSETKKALKTLEKNVRQQIMIALDEEFV
jgi:hypothetical protein